MKRTVLYEISLANLSLLVFSDPLKPKTFALYVCIAHGLASLRVQHRTKQTPQGPRSQQTFNTFQEKKVN